jgi:monothiol glutaredoxin
LAAIPQKAPSGAFLMPAPEKGFSRHAACGGGGIIPRFAHTQRTRIMDQDTRQRIDGIIKGHDIVLFMKGNTTFPQCGFSGRAVQILKACGIEPRTLASVDVLKDDAIRQGIKEYSNWPTIPQLYVKGEFVGGSDIMMEMYESGELQQLVAA